MINQIPNLFTLSNLFCGCCTLVFLLRGQPEMVPWLLAGSFLFDYGDGMTARALGICSPLGKELDSLADVVSFGVVPGAMLYVMLEKLLGGQEPSGFVCLSSLPAFILSACAAMRLGKFNIDTRQTTYFIGLTTPATTVFVLGLFLTAQTDYLGLASIILHPILLYTLIPVLCYLMLSEIPMFGMKIKGLSLKDNRINLLFLGVFVLVAIVLKPLALSAIIILYILASLIWPEKIRNG